MSSDTDDRPAVDQAIVDALKQRRADHAVIASGKLPRLRELYAGAPFFGGRMDLDIQHWVDEVLAKGGVVINVAALERVRNTCGPEALAAAREVIPLGDVAGRLDLDLACTGSDDDARHRVVRAISERVVGWRRDVGWMYRMATMRGLQMQQLADMQQYCEVGLRDLRSVSSSIGELTIAQLALEADASRSEVSGPD